jgi:hypothetical protein
MGILGALILKLGNLELIQYLFCPFHGAVSRVDEGIFDLVVLDLSICGYGIFCQT